MPSRHLPFLSLVKKPRDHGLGFSKSSLNENFISKFGEEAFHDGWGPILSLDPDFFASSFFVAFVPRQKNHLSLKDQQLFALTVDCAAIQLYVPGIRSNIKAALREGASKDEIMEVIKLSSTLGIHACNIGISLLVEVLKEDDRYKDFHDKFFNENQLELKERFTTNRGYGHEFWDDSLSLDSEFFEAYLDFSSAPWQQRTITGRQIRGDFLSSKVCKAKHNPRKIEKSRTRADLA